MSALLLYLLRRQHRKQARHAGVVPPQVPVTTQFAAAGGDGVSQPAQPAVPQYLPGGPGLQGGGYRPRRRVPRWVWWLAGAVVLGLVFRRIVIWALVAFTGLLGFNLGLPHVQFAWPWQTSATHVTTNTDLGPWILQKVEGISQPVLGQANFTFTFTHKVNKSIGFWPCWYQSTFTATGHAGATVDLNPGPSWWAPGTGHLLLRVIKAPTGGHGGAVAVTMALPVPSLPGNAHQVTIDDLPSHPIDTQHSWTYPGVACGLVLKPQFPESVLYAQAQEIAYYKATRSLFVTRPLIARAEQEAAQMLGGDLRPALAALGYSATFTIQWVAPPPPPHARPGL